MKKTINTIYRFFRPDDTRLKIEAVTEAYYNAETKKLTVHRKFYTFRALANFAFWYVTKNPYEKAKKQLENLQNNPAYAYKLAGLTAVFLFTAILDIKNIHNVVLVAGSIAYDATTNRTSEAGASTTFSHTTSGSNRILTVAVGSYRGLSSCTYAGTSMTLGPNASQGQAKSGIFYLGNPTSGANNVVFTPTSSGMDHISAISFSGGNTSAPNGVTGTNTGTNSDTLSKSVTTTQANSFLVDAFATEDDSAHVYGADAGQTGRMWGQANFWGGGGASTKPTTTIGSYTMGWTKSSGAQANNLSISVLEIKELAPQNYTQSLTESITLVETRLNTTSKPFIEAITLIETQLKRAGKVVTETITLSEVFSRLQTAFRSLTETITLVDTVDPNKIAILQLVESISVVDAYRNVSGKVLTETITLVETFTKALTAFRSFTETITLVDTIGTVRTFLKTLTESITLVESFVKSTAKSFVETIELSETMQNVKIYARSFVEAITLVDTTGTGRTKYQVLNETITLVDSARRVTSKILTETLNIVERFLGMLNGKDISYRSKYEDRPGTYFKKYLDF